MKPADKGGGGKPSPQSASSTDPTDPHGRPLSADDLNFDEPFEPTINVEPQENPLPPELEEPFESTINIVDASDIIEPTGERPAIVPGKPLPPGPGSAYEPTVNVSPDVGLVNDPRRIVLPRTAGEADPTKNVMPQRLDLPPQALQRPPPLSEPTINVSPDLGLVNDPRRVLGPRDAAQAAPTVNVAPDPGVHNDPNRVFVARNEAQAAPTVNVVPDPALYNDPNRVFVARAEAQVAPTVNVVPDPALYNDPNRIFVARAEKAAAPTVNVVPDRSLHNDPNLLWVRELPPEPPTATGAPPAAAKVPEGSRPTPGSGLLWVREEPETPQTVNTVPGTGSSKTTDPNPSVLTPASWKSTEPGPHGPQPESTVRTDPDATGSSTGPYPWEAPPPGKGESTVQLDLPAEAQALTNALQGVRPLSAPRPIVPLGEESNPGNVAKRPSGPKPAKLDGVAPLVPIQHFPHINPAIDVTARTDPPTQYGAGPPPGVPISILANYQPPAPAEASTQHAPPPVEAWRHSPEVENWVPEEADHTRVMSRAEKAPTGLRPPNMRDMLVIALGFVLVCISMVLIRREPREGSGPIAAQKIKPPSGYVAPAPVKESMPYLAPDQKSTEGRYTMAGATSDYSGGGSSSGGAAAAPDNSSPQSAGGAGMALPPTRLPIPRCTVNPLTSLDTKVRWVVEGKKKLLELKVTPTRIAIQKANLFVASASYPEQTEIERTENAAVYFLVFLEPEPKADVVKVVLDCECGLANAEVLATIDKKELKVDLKMAKVTPPEIIAAKARKKR